MNKAVIFDLDGVIVDTAKYHYKAWQNVAKVLGFQFTKEQNETLKGVSRVKSLDILIGLSGKTISNKEKEALLISKNEEYLISVAEMQADEILDGIVEVLDYLDENKIKYALGSASKNAPLILKKVGLFDRFIAIVDGNDVSKAKPNPEVFLIAAKKLDLNPENCIVIEDAVAGVTAANAANMLSIGIGEQDILSHADIILKDTSRLTIKLLNSIFF
ncbi:MAG: beta-phosphoglucomutase [Flavobacteriaceae bacterium]